jgi:DNA-directed RNA polymerase specialized sigma24 family protein
MKIEIWITNNYERLLENAMRITSNRDKASDVLHQCLTDLLGYPDDKKDRLSTEGKLENYITRCVNIQYKSITSPYHKFHRKQSMNEIEYMDFKHDSPDIIDEIDEYGIQCDCIFNELDKLHYYYRILLTDKFIEKLTYHQMNIKYRISKNSLLRDVHEGVRMLKNKCIK